MPNPGCRIICTTTKGTEFSDAKPYRNIAEPWDLSSNDPALMSVMIDAYVNEFSPELQEQIALNVNEALLMQHGFDLAHIAHQVNKSF